MLRKLLVTAVMMGIAYCGWFAICYGIPGTDSYKKDRYYEEVSAYTHDREVRVTRYAIALAYDTKAIDAWERERLSARLEKIESERGRFRLDIPEDTESKIMQEVLHKIGFACVGRVENRTGMNYNYDSQKPEWKAVLEIELAPYKDLKRMDRILNRLTWNYAGRLWEKSFKTEYTMDELARDREEYERLRPELEELMAKHGIR